MLKPVVVKGQFPKELYGFTLFDMFMDLDMLGYAMDKTGTDASPQFHDKFWDGDHPASGLKDPEDPQRIKEYGLIEFNESGYSGVKSVLPGLDFNTGGGSHQSLKLEFSGLKVVRLEKPYPLEDPGTNPEMKEKEYITELLYVDKINIGVSSGTDVKSDTKILNFQLTGNYNYESGGFRAADKRFIGYRKEKPTETMIKKKPGREIPRVFIARPELSVSGDPSVTWFKDRLVSNIKEIFTNLGCLVQQREEDAKYLITVKMNPLADHKSEVLLEVMNRRIKSSMLTLYWVLVDDDPDNVQQFQEKVVEQFNARLGDRLGATEKKRVDIISGQILVGKYITNKCGEKIKKVDDTGIRRMFEAEQAFKEGYYQKAERILEILIINDENYLRYQPARSLLARCKVKLFKYEEALEQLDELEKKYHDRNTNDSLDPSVLSLTGEINLEKSDVRMAMGHYEEALEEAKKAYSNFSNEKCYGPKHPLTSRCLRKIASIQTAMAGMNSEMSLYEASEESVRESLKVDAQYYGPGSPMMQDSYQQLGKSLLQARKNYKAVEPLVMNLKISEQQDNERNDNEKKQNVDIDNGKIDGASNDTADSCLLLGANYLGLGQNDRAIKYLELSEKIRKKNSEAIDKKDPKLAAEAIALAAGYDRKQKKDKSAEYFDRASSIINNAGSLILNAEEKKKYFSEIFPAYGMPGFYELVNSLSLIKKKGEDKFLSLMGLVRSAMDGNWVSDLAKAFSPGNDDSGNKFYLCREQDEEEGITSAVGIVSRGGSACLTDSGRVLPSGDFQTLAFQEIEFFAEGASDIRSKFPHVAGLDAEGMPVNICRVKEGKGIYIGRFLKDRGVCAYTEGKTRKYAQQFDVLVDK